MRVDAAPADEARRARSPPGGTPSTGSELVGLVGDLDAARPEEHALEPGALQPPGVAWRT